MGDVCADNMCDESYFRSLHEIPYTHTCFMNNTLFGMIPIDIPSTDHPSRRYKIRSMHSDGIRASQGRRPTCGVKFILESAFNMRHTPSFTPLQLFQSSANTQSIEERCTLDGEVIGLMESVKKLRSESVLSSSTSSSNMRHNTSFRQLLSLERFAGTQTNEQKSTPDGRTSRLMRIVRRMDQLPFVRSNVVQHDTIHPPRSHRASNASPAHERMVSGALLMMGL